MAHFLFYLVYSILSSLPIFNHPYTTRWIEIRRALFLQFWLGSLDFYHFWAKSLWMSVFYAKYRTLFIQKFSKVLILSYYWLNAVMEKTMYVDYVHDFNCLMNHKLWWKKLKTIVLPECYPSRRHVFIFEFRSLERKWVLHFEPKLRISNCGISYYVIHTKPVSI